MDAGPRRTQSRHRCSEICKFRRHQGAYLPSAPKVLISHTHTSCMQGFLRRVHRWPILTDEIQQQQPPESKPTTLPPSPSPVSSARKRASSLSVAPHATFVRPKRRISEVVPAFAAVSAYSTSGTGTVSPPPRLAEASLGTLRARAGPPPRSPQPIRVREPRRNSTTTTASLFEIAQALAVP